MPLVEVTTRIPDAIVDMRYATDRNMLYKPIPGALITPKLEQRAARGLVHAADRFRSLGLRLVIWDAYRPAEVHEMLLAHQPDRQFVRDDSLHLSGMAVDLSLAELDGQLLDMGTDHDHFSEHAYADATDLEPEQLAARQLLITTMSENGFQVWPQEWWHHDYVGYGS